MVLHGWTVRAGRGGDGSVAWFVYIQRYNNGWLLQRHGYMTPARVREQLSREAA